jgi:archaellum biogenesis ATPase FlaH
MNTDWISLEDAFRKETALRENMDVNKLCTYGIKPLDDSLICLAKNELVVIGSDSGSGKSELGINIARTNIKRGKRVALYYLEGGYEEAISRMKWRDIAEEYYKGYPHLRIDMDYRKWMLNIEKDKILEEIECRLWERYKAEYQNNLYLHSSKQGMTVDNLISSLLEFHKLVPNDESESPFDTTGKMDLDLIIIDHLQYFSLTKSENEIFEITEILRTVKSITDNFKIPVVLISHLRKKARDRGLPGQEDFYGSSNIPKIASTVITITPSSEKDDIASGIYPTYLRVVKSRIGVRPNYAFLVDFDLHKRCYADKYEIYRLDNYGNIKTEPLGREEQPKWARKKHYAE